MRPLELFENNPRREEIARQMSAANPSEILAKTGRAAIADRPQVVIFIE